MVVKWPAYDPPAVYAGRSANRGLSRAPDFEPLEPNTNRFPGKTYGMSIGVLPLPFGDSPRFDNCSTRREDRRMYRAESARIAPATGELNRTGPEIFIVSWATSFAGADSPISFGDARLCTTNWT